MNSYVRQFEREFAQIVGTGRAFAFWRGRVALYAILRAMGVGPNDEVILPGYTCVMDVNPIKYVGAKPIYVDIEPVTYNMDVSLLESAITPKTKVILAQHTYGYPCEMDAIMEIASRNGVAVVEDCCLAMGSKYKGRLCGTMGKAAYFSFQWNKPFTTGIGGMAVTSDNNLANGIEQLCKKELVPNDTKAARMLAIQRIIYRTVIYPRTTALATSLFRWLTRLGAVVGSSSTSEFRPVMAKDFFMGMSDGQARAGLRQLRKVESNMSHRRSLRRMYDDLLAKAGWSVPAIPEYIDPVLVRYPVRVADKVKAVAKAPCAGVELGTWFECPLHPIETPMSLYDYVDGQCPVAEQACREVANLPMHPRVSQSAARRGIRFVKQIGRAAK